MKAIYTDYRVAAYLSLRRKYEPWFNEKEANVNVVNKVFINSRKDFMKKATSAVGINMAKIISILDFGGDLGQFIPDEISGNRYLLDPSYTGKEKQNSDVIRVKTLLDVPEKLEFVMNCHTIEHLPDFQDAVVEIHSSLKEGGYFYLEVPLDYFKTSIFQKSKLYGKYLKLLVNSRRLFTLVDFLTGVCRQFFGVIPALGIVKQSEHINYFDLNSATTLLDKCGFKILNVQGPDRKFKQGKFRFGRLGILSVKTS
jgi:SAM-dependent methyltransferase